MEEYKTEYYDTDNSTQELNIVEDESIITDNLYEDDDLNIEQDVYNHIDNNKNSVDDNTAYLDFTDELNDEDIDRFKEDIDGKMSADDYLDNINDELEYILSNTDISYKERLQVEKLTKRINYLKSNIANNPIAQKNLIKDRYRDLKSIKNLDVKKAIKRLSKNINKIEKVANPNKIQKTKIFLIDLITSIIQGWKKGFRKGKAFSQNMGNGTKNIVKSIKSHKQVVKTGDIKPLNTVSQKELKVLQEQSNKINNSFFKLKI